MIRSNAAGNQLVFCQGKEGGFAGSADTGEYFDDGFVDVRSYFLEISFPRVERIHENYMNIILRSEITLRFRELFTP